MVHKPTILRLRRIAGYGSVHRETHTTRRTIWLLAISAQQAVTFVEQMIPFMLTKRGEAIAFLALAREQKGKHGVPMSATRRRFHQSHLRRIAALKRQEWKR